MQKRKWRNLILKLLRRDLSSSHRVLWRNKDQRSNQRRVVRRHRAHLAQLLVHLQVFTHDQIDRAFEAGAARKFIRYCMLFYREMHIFQQRCSHQCMWCAIAGWIVGWALHVNSTDLEEGDCGIF